MRCALPWLLALSLLSTAARADYQNEILPILEEYCFDCHGDGSKKGDFSMDKFSNLAAHVQDQEHWLSIWRNVRSQIMPPSEKTQLPYSDKIKLLAWIERKVLKLDSDNPDPGRVTIRRLNREEYKNAIFDLLGVEFDTAESFPPDDTGYGFDNIGDVLSISPILMEKYLTAAEEIVHQALPKGAAAQVPRFDLPGENLQAPGDPKTTGRWLPFAEQNQIRIQHEIQWDGDYRVELEFSIQGAMEATDHAADLEFFAGGQSVNSERLGWDHRRVIRLSGEAHLKKGLQVFEVKLSPNRRPSGEEEELALVLRRVIVRGPLDGSQTEYSKGYRMIFVDGPAPKEQEARYQYARRIMRSFVSRAFRKPLDRSTIDRLVKIVKEVDNHPGKSFEDGIKQAIATCLASPRFLFRIEIQPEPNNPGRIVPLDDYSLAARLSFFLWGSVPDDELLSLAYKRNLRKNLREQVDRMLADPRSARLVRNFVGQWLQARDVETAAVDPKSILGISTKREAARLFDPRLRKDMRIETEMLFDFILRKGRPAEELISARYTFLNERLAHFYGIEGVMGEQFQPVDLTEHPQRGGILTQGTFLIVSSNPTRTSPVKRGLFVLENLLGTPAPPAPGNVPPLEQAKGTTANPTMREMMEIHRVKPVCKGCHARMDPIGLGLEHFNALGQFRTTENGKPIESGGKLITGERFSDVASLKRILATNRKEDFYRCLSEKLLTFAIGRGVEYYDAPTIDFLVKRLESKQGNLRELIHGIIESAPFQKRRGAE
jgi:hypothetical protein